MSRRLPEAAYEEGFNRGKYSGEYSAIYQNKRMMKILEKCSSDTFTKIASSYERGVAEGVMAFSDRMDIRFKSQSPVAINYILC